MKSNKPSLFQFMSTKDKVIMFVGAILAIGNGIVLAAFSYILGDYFDAVNEENNLSQINQLALIFFYIGIASWVCGWAQLTCFSMISDHLILKIREKYLDALLKKKVAFFDKESSGLASVVSENCVVIRDGFAEKLGMLVGNTSTALSGIILGFIIMPLLALALFAAAPILGYGGLLFARVISQSTESRLKDYAEAGSISEETLSQIRTVAGLCAEKAKISQYQTAIKKAEKTGILQAKKAGFGVGFANATIFFAFALAYWLGAVLIQNSANDAAERFPPTISGCSVGSPVLSECQAFTSASIFNTEADVCSCPSCQCGCFYPQFSGGACYTGGDVVICFFAFFIGLMSLGQIPSGLTALSSAISAGDKVLAVIYDTSSFEDTSDDGSKNNEETSTKTLDLLPVSSLSIQSITFSYPTRQEYPIFEKFSLVIEAGKSTAFVGESGCGKSTLMQLIQRFYEPDSGSILFGSQDISKLDVNYWRQHLAFVSQEPILFTTTIAENIAFGSNKPVSMKEIEQAAKDANAYNFIMEFPDGFNTFVGGSKLSGGQKQRIAIARALIRKSRIMLLDEATSALDNASQKIVQDCLNKIIVSSGLTTLVIAHRLSTIQDCDKIVVLDKGKILEQGSHSELLSKNGTYAALVHVGEQGNLAHHQSVVEERKNNEKLEKMQGGLGSIRIISDNPSSDSAKATFSENESKSNTNKNDIKAGYFDAYRFVPKSDRKFIFFAVLACIINGLVFPAFAIIFSQASASFYKLPYATMIHESEVWAGGFVGVGLASFIASFGDLAIFGYLSNKITTAVRSKLFEKLLSREIGFFDDPKHGVGALSSKLSTDAALVKAAVTDRLSLMITNTIAISAGIVISFVASWKLSLIVFAILPLLIIGGVVQMMAMGGIAKEDSKQLEASTNVLSESISGIRTVKSFNLQESTLRLYRELLRGPSDKSVQKAVISGFAFGFSNAILFFGYALAFWQGGVMIDNGEITFAQMLTAFFGISMSGQAVGSQTALLPDVSKGKNAMISIATELSSESKINPFEPSGEQPGQVFGDITFVDVSFSYPQRLNQTVFNKLNLTITRDQSVGIVGTSGSGKSTIIQLLCRFYNPSSGSILLDGREIKDLNLQWLRTQIGLVSQEPQLFDTTIEENIRYGKPDATQEEIDEAAKSAHAYEFIMQMPEKYKTKVGARGGKISGGQKQRICIARALLRKPRILLLDEATAALDNESEHIVQIALDELLKTQHRTTIIIAHRLSSIKACDNIIVLDHGSVVQSGNHDSLMNQENGSYAKLYNAQQEQQQSNPEQEEASI